MNVLSKRTDLLRRKWCSLSANGRNILNLSFRPLPRRSRETIRRNGLSVADLLRWKVKKNVNEGNSWREVWFKLSRTKEYDVFVKEYLRQFRIRSILTRCSLIFPKSDSIYDNVSIISFYAKQSKLYGWKKKFESTYVYSSILLYELRITCWIIIKIKTNMTKARQRKYT